MEAALVFEDGKIYRGRSAGAEGETVGEVVFNTSMTGYQEILTDPSYAGQIITMTYPLIGNYGVNMENMESGKIHAKGLIVEEICDYPSHWRLSGRLQEFLLENNTLGIAGIDTRDLTRRLRTRGTMKGLLTTRGSLSDAELLEKVRTATDLCSDLPRIVTTPKAYGTGGNGPRVVLVDFGAKQNIVRSLVKLGCSVTVVPCWTTAEEIMRYRPQGILLSNGPGDPSDVPYAVQTTRELLGKVPVFGICLGHQIMGLAAGAKTYKLKFGHRGANHPVKDLASGRIYITSQNHGYAIDENSLKGVQIDVTHRNLNDGTVEGLVYKQVPAFSVQYHPEASPGPQDSAYLFKRFLEML